jgi:hypothetical protein
VEDDNLGVLSPKAAKCLLSGYAQPKDYQLFAFDRAYYHLRAEWHSDFCMKMLDLVRRDEAVQRLDLGGRILLCCIL